MAYSKGELNPVQGLRISELLGSGFKLSFGLHPGTPFTRGLTLGGFFPVKGCAKRAPLKGTLLTEESSGVFLGFPRDYKRGRFLNTKEKSPQGGAPKTEPTWAPKKQRAAF